MPDFTLRELAPGILAALGGVCNRGIIADRGSVLVVDAGISVAEATPLRTAAQEYRKQGSLSLFNTHPHGDHVFGNQVFTDAPIIAHSGVRENMVAIGEQTLTGWKQNPQMSAMIGEVTITPPSVTFQDALTIFVGEIEVQLLYYGVAHSPSDSVAWLPQSRTLFTGDLLFNELVPAMPPGSNAVNWLQALESLQQLGAQQVIPGHGPIQTPEALNTLHVWMIELQRRVSSAITSGWDLETSPMQIAADMQASFPRKKEERLPIAIQRVYESVKR